MGKMKIEAEMGTLTADLDEMASEAGMSEEKAQRAMIDAARLADELRGEQEMAQSLEREKKLLEAQVKDMQSRVDEAQTNALKGGKKAMTKMDTRIRELESELDAENRRQSDAQKNLRKSERRIKELAYQQDEDRKNHERMQALIDQLQGKIKSYKKQIEEAEEIAALNLAKYRQAQNNVAGMVAIPDPERKVNVEKLYEGLREKLPAYARPIFVRLVNKIDVTATYKLKKRDLQSEGFNPELVGKGSVHMLDSKQQCYQPLSQEQYNNIINGNLRF